MGWLSSRWEPFVLALVVAIVLVAIAWMVMVLIDQNQACEDMHSRISRSLASVQETSTVLQQPLPLTQPEPQPVLDAQDLSIPVFDMFPTVSPSMSESAFAFASVSAFDAKANANANANANTPSTSDPAEPYIGEIRTQLSRLETMLAELPQSRPQPQSRSPPPPPPPHHPEPVAESQKQKIEVASSPLTATSSLPPSSSSGSASASVPVEQADHKHTKETSDSSSPPPPQPLSTVDVIIGHMKRAFGLGPKPASSEALATDTTVATKNNTKSFSFGLDTSHDMKPNDLQSDPKVHQALNRVAGAQLVPFFPSRSDTTASDWIILSVGLNYTWSTANRLDSCWNDQDALETLVCNRYLGGAVPRILRCSDRPSGSSTMDGESMGEPTRRTLQKAVDKAVRHAQSVAEQGRTPCLVFIYSGHGFFKWTTDPTELSGKSECFLMKDGAYWDYELYDELIARLPASARLLLLSDACHSESNANLPYSVHPVTKRLVLSSGNVRVAAKCLGLSACRDEQTAQAGASTRDMSAFTRELVAWLRDARPKFARDGIVDMRTRLLQSGDMQIPTMSVSQPDLVDAAL
jgi:hypothetical protein